VVSSQEFTFERIDVDQGLSQNNVVDVFQDSKGYLWMATHEGANRYNGMEFEVFRISDSDTANIPSNLISRFAEDSKGNIWISTLDRGVCMYSYKTERFISFLNTEENPFILQSNYIRNIFCDSSDRVFIATTEGVDCIRQSIDGEYVVSHVKSLPLELTEGSPLDFNKFYEDKNGNVLVLLWDKVAKICPIDEKSDSLQLKLFFEKLPFNSLRMISEYNNSWLFGHSEGFSQVFIDTLKRTPYQINSIDIGRVLEFVQIDDSVIWAGSDRGMYRLEYTKDQTKGFKQTHHFTAGDNEYSISNNNIISVSKDNSGGLWIGSNGGGVCKLSKLNRQFKSYKSTLTSGSLSTNKVLSIYEDSNLNLWIGTEGGGINLLASNQEKDYSSGFDKLYLTTPNEQHTVYDILEVGSDIWMGTAYNSLLVQLKRKSGKWEELLGQIPIDDALVLAIYEDSYGNVWMGTYGGGLYKAIPTAKAYKLKHYSETTSNLCSNTIRSFLEDSKGRLWIGSINGLMVLNSDGINSENPSFKTFKFSKIDSASLSNNHVIPLVEGHDGSIWIGTLGGGLNRYIEGDSWDNGYFERWTVEDGLSNNSIKEIIEDDEGDLWIGTNKGLIRFNHKERTIRNYNYKDGIQSLEFVERAGCKRHDGEILMGGVNGFNAFYPNDVKKDTIAPHLVLSKLEIVNKTVGVNDEINGKVLLKQPLNDTERIILSHTEKNFTIHFVALHMANPEFNQYKYRLVGYDEHWIKTTSYRRFAKYTNLDEGIYTFEVAASNSDGFWTKEPKTLQVIIQPPYYKTATFKLLTVFLTLFLILSFYIWKIRSIRKQKAKLELLVNKRTAELQETNIQIEESREEIIAQKEALLVKTVQLEAKSKELEYHKENLEELVLERTNELKEALEHVKEADKLKSAFLGNMSHEIRTPLNAVVGFSQILAGEDLEPEEQKEFRELIHSNAEKLLLIIDDVLSISMIESNQLVLNDSTFDLNYFLQDCLHTSKVNCKNEDIEFKLLHPYEFKNLQIQSDKLRLGQILTNLLNNAVKFTHEGSITLSTKMDDRGNLYNTTYNSYHYLRQKNKPYI